ncbi:hypothetical protein [Litoribacter populi]|uniref:hypothetical protein n=1 Tax=Litoribacter populi TaxID=2598460 RepID=UPI001180DAAA|nr:hypothetical protein [Litoribacter populi]
MKTISINQFVKYQAATERGRQSIIKAQTNPNPYRTPWYQLAKARIKKYLQNPIDVSPITAGIEELKSRTPQNKRQKSDFPFSIEALKRVASMKLPKLLYEHPYEVIIPEDKAIKLNGLQININPEVIVKATINGQIVYGGVKIYLAKSKALTLTQSKTQSTLLYHYLTEKIAMKGEIVLPELCFSLDVFNNRWVAAYGDDQAAFDEIERQCEEIVRGWDVL